MAKSVKRAKKKFGTNWEKNKSKDLSGYAFVGFLFLGMGIGALAGRWDAGPFLGLGLGFIAALFVKMKY